MSKDAECFHCGKTGHWRRNCKAYLEDKKKGGATSASGIFVIEVNLSTSTSWVLDTGCGSHICVNLQKLTRSRLLTKGEVDLRVGNGARVAALAVGTYVLDLPNGLVLELDNCYYVPSITRNIISISFLDKKGFRFDIRNKCCSMFYDDVLYGIAPLYNGL